MKKNRLILLELLLVTLFMLLNSCSENEDNNTESFSIGQNYGGGTIFYIDNTGQHGLIVSPSNQGSNIAWSNGDLTTTLATATNVGAGQPNTKAIIAAHGAGNYAAYLCDTLELNGYSDWFLPSKDELNLLYQQKLIGTVYGFANEIYWSSTEYNNEDAWWLHFGDPSWNWQHCYTDGTSFYPQVEGKPSLNYVRAIRTF